MNSLVRDCSAKECPIAFFAEEVQNRRTDYRPDGWASAIALTDPMNRFKLDYPQRTSVIVLGVTIRRSDGMLEILQGSERINHCWFRNIGSGTLLRLMHSAATE